MLKNLVVILGSQPGRFELAILRLLKSPPWEETLANNITMARMRIGFYGIHGLYWPYVLLPQFHWMVWGAFIALVVAASLDGVDGLVARTLKCESDFGRFIDPFADKTIVWSAFFVLMYHYQGAWWLLTPVIGILLYDVSVSWARMNDKEMRTNWVAKWKQWPLDIGCGALLVGVLLDWNVVYGVGGNRAAAYDFTRIGGGLLLWIALILAAVSAFIYHKRRILLAYYRGALTIQRMTALFF